MDKVLLDIEYYHLQDTEARDIILPDGEAVRIEMWRLHWLWYDRFTMRDFAFPTKVGKLIRQEVELSGYSYSDVLTGIIVAYVQKLHERGEDPYESKADLAKRKSKLWRLRKMLATA